MSSVKQRQEVKRVAGVSDHSAHAHTYTYAHINFSLNLSREKRENSAEKGERARGSSLKSSAADV
jgi:hypothetical protein